MRAVDPEPIREKLRRGRGLDRRDRASSPDRALAREHCSRTKAIGALVHAHPGIDTQRLRALVRNAREERNAGRPPRAYRELFRALRDIIADSQPVPDDDGE